MSNFGLVRESGDRNTPAIVFLHGGGINSSQWTPQLDALSDTFYCLAPDLPEHGQSRDLAPFTLADAAARTIALIKSLPARRAHVVGLSLGGAVALEVARRGGAAVDHVLVSGATAGLSRMLGALSNASAVMYRWLPKGWLLRQAVKQFSLPDVYVPALRDDLLHSFDPGFTRRMTQALMDVRLPERARLLATVGERETSVAKGEAKKIAAQIAGAEARLVRGVGHVWNLEAPDLFNATVRAFVTDAPLPAGLLTLNQATAAARSPVL